MNSEKKIAIFDLDGTLVSSHLWLGLAKYYFKKKENIFPTLWFIISHLSFLPFWKMGLIPTEKYYKSWVKDMSQIMRGIRLDREKEIFNWLTDNYLLPTLKNNVFDRLKQHQKDGFLTILISGSFQNLLDIIANRLNIDFAIGTKLEMVKDKFSGKIIPPVCFGQEKMKMVKSFLNEKNLKINFKESFSYSDSVFDLPILEFVGNPVVVEPDKNLLSVAKNKGWEII